MKPREKHHAHRPRAGHRVIYQSPYWGEMVGTVTTVENSICWVEYPGHDSTSFIWCFLEGLNSLHDWPTKSCHTESCHTESCHTKDGRP